VIEGGYQLANLPKGERRAVIQVDTDLWQVSGLRQKAPESTDYIRHNCNATCGFKVIRIVFSVIYKGLITYQQLHPYVIVVYLLFLMVYFLARLLRSNIRAIVMT
jgi:hypothetical protein